MKWVLNSRKDFYLFFLFSDEIQIANLTNKRIANDFIVINKEKCNKLQTFM